MIANSHIQYIIEVIPQELNNEAVFIILRDDSKQLDHKEKALKSFLRNYSETAQPSEAHTKLARVIAYQLALAYPQKDITTHQIAFENLFPKTQLEVCAGDMTQEQFINGQYMHEMDANTRIIFPFYYKNYYDLLVDVQQFLFEYKADENDPLSESDIPIEAQLKFIPYQILMHRLLNSIQSNRQYRALAILLKANNVSVDPPVAYSLIQVLKELTERLVSSTIDKNTESCFSNNHKALTILLKASSCVEQLQMRPLILIQDSVQQEKNQVNNQDKILFTRQHPGKLNQANRSELLTIIANYDDLELPESADQIVLTFDKLLPDKLNKIKNIFNFVVEMNDHRSAMLFLKAYFGETLNLLQQEGGIENHLFTLKLCNRYFADLGSQKKYYIDLIVIYLQQPATAEDILHNEYLQELMLMLYQEVENDIFSTLNVGACVCATLKNSDDFYQLLKKFKQHPDFLDAIIKQLSMHIKEIITDGSQLYTIIENLMIDLGAEEQSSNAIDYSPIITLISCLGNNLDNLIKDKAKLSPFLNSITDYYGKYIIKNMSQTHLQKLFPTLKDIDDFECSDDDAFGELIINIIIPKPATYITNFEQLKNVLNSIPDEGNVVKLIDTMGTTIQTFITELEHFIALFSVQDITLGLKYIETFQDKFNIWITTYDHLKLILTRLGFHSSLMMKIMTHQSTRLLSLIKNQDQLCEILNMTSLKIENYSTLSEVIKTHIKNLAQLCSVIKTLNSKHYHSYSIRKLLTQELDYFKGMIISSDDIISIISNIANAQTYMSFLNQINETNNAALEDLLKSKSFCLLKTIIYFAKQLPLELTKESSAMERNNHAALNNIIMPHSIKYIISVVKENTELKSINDIFYQLGMTGIFQLSEAELKLHELFFNITLQISHLPKHPLPAPSKGVFYSLLPVDSPHYADLRILVGDNANIPSVIDIVNQHIGQYYQISNLDKLYQQLQAVGVNLPRVTNDEHISKIGKFERPST